MGICDVGLYPLEVEVSKSRKKHYEGGKNLKTAFCRAWKRAKSSKIKIYKMFGKTIGGPYKCICGGFWRRYILLKPWIVEISEKTLGRGGNSLYGTLQGSEKGEKLKNKGF